MLCVCEIHLRCRFKKRGQRETSSHNLVRVAQKAAAAPTEHREAKAKRQS